MPFDEQGNYVIPADMAAQATDYRKMRNYAVQRGLAGTRDARAGRSPGAGVSRFWADPNTLGIVDPADKAEMLARFAELQARLAKYDAEARSGGVSSKTQGELQKGITDLLKTITTESASSSRKTADLKSRAANAKYKEAKAAQNKALEGIVEFDELPAQAETVIDEIITGMTSGPRSNLTAQAALKLKGLGDIYTARAALAEVAARTGKSYDEVFADITSPESNPDGSAGSEWLQPDELMWFAQMEMKTSKKFAAYDQATKDLWDAQKDLDKAGGAGLGGAASFAGELQGLFTDYLKLVRAGEPIPPSMQEALQGMGYKFTEALKTSETTPSPAQDTMDKALEELEKGTVDPVLIRMKRAIVSDDRFKEYMEMKGYTDADYAFKKFMQDARRMKRQNVRTSREAERANRIGGISGGLLADVQRLLAGEEGRKSAEEDIQLRQANVRTRQFKEKAEESGLPPGPPLDLSREEGAAHGSDDEEFEFEDEQYKVPDVTRQDEGAPEIELDLHEDEDLQGDGGTDGGEATINEPPNMSGAAEEPTDSQTGALRESLKRLTSSFRPGQ